MKLPAIKYPHLYFAATIWSILLLVLLGFLFTRWQAGIGFDTSLMALLPKEEQYPVLAQAEQQLVKQFSNQLLILVGGKKDSDARQQAIDLVNVLEKLPVITKVSSSPADFSAAFDNTLANKHYFRLLDKQTANLIDAGNSSIVRANALQNLFSPIGFSSANLLKDPFNLNAQALLNQSSSLSLEIDGDMLVRRVSGDQYFVILLELAGDPFDLTLQQQLLPRLEAAQKQAKNTGIEILISGLLIHAAEGARQAQQEISTIGVGALIGIIALILLVFRRVTSLILVLLPITVGCLGGLAACLLIFDRVHMITLAFGAGLVGVSVDYILHLLCARFRAKNNLEALQRVLPGLALGLATSVLAYGAQALTPFPGLQQMAVFSAAGLISAWLTVVCFIPLLLQNQPPKAPELFFWMDKLRQYWPAFNGKPQTALILGLILSIGCGLMFTLDAEDNVRLLQTSPAALLAQEKRVQTLMQRPESSRYLLVQADSLERLLETLESLEAPLDALRAQSLLQNYFTLAQRVPSSQRQQENIKRVQRLYREQLASFFGQAGLPEKMVAKANAELSEAARLIPDLQQWVEQAAVAQSQYIWLGKTPKGVASIVPLVGAESDIVWQKIQQIASQNPDVEAVDRIARLSALLGHHREQISYWLLLAYLAVCILLFSRYRFDLWRIIFPPLLASIITLLVISHFAGGVNLFHLMALLLVLGIGMDMGIFLLETGSSDDTWTAVSCSAVTSLLAFGLLAVSQTPVLHHFGLTVLLGLSLIWLIAPYCRPKKDYNTEGDLK